MPLAAMMAAGTGGLHARRRRRRRSDKLSAMPSGACIGYAGTEDQFVENNSQEGNAADSLSRESVAPAIRQPGNVRV